MREDQIRGLSTARLVDLKPLVGKLAQDRIDKELSRRIKAKAAEPADTTQGPLPSGTFILDKLPTSKNAIHIPIVNNGKPAIVLSKAARGWAKWARREIKQAWGDRPPILGDVDIQVMAIFTNPRRDGHNLEELLYDTMEGICFADDSQIRDRVFRTRIVKERNGLIVQVRAHFPEETMIS